MSSIAERLKFARQNMGLTREVFGGFVGLGYLRMSNIENDRGRITGDDLSAITRAFPELTDFLLHGTPLDPIRLGASENKYIKNLADQISILAMKNNGQGIE